MKSGRGKEYGENGRLLYSGNFEQDHYNGEGTLYYKDIRKMVKEYTGCFLGGVKSGDGILFHDNGKIYYAGEFVDGHPEGGCCKVFDENSSLWYKGAMVGGQKSGYGEEFYENGNLMYEGNFLNNFPDGLVKTFHENGKICYHGCMQEGTKQGDGT